MCGAMVYMFLAAGAVVSATHPGMAMGGPAEPAASRCSPWSWRSSWWAT